MWRDTQLTISSGQLESPELNVSAVFPAGKLAMVIIAPGTLPETVKIHVGKAIGGGYATLQSDGADITLPAGAATPLITIIAGAMKLVAGGAVAGDRTFTILAVPTR